MSEEKVLVRSVLLKKNINSKEYRKLNKKVENEAGEKEGVKNGGKVVKSTISDPQKRVRS